MIPGVTRAWASRSARSSRSKRDIARFVWARPMRRPNGTFNTHERLNQSPSECAQAREGVGKNGDWCVDFHQRFDLSEAVRGCEVDSRLRALLRGRPGAGGGVSGRHPAAAQKVSVPIAAGEEWGNRWDFNKLVEAHDIDYVRATLPNVGGITEMMKIAAMCETHFVGIVPHFTGPISTAALVQLPGHIFRAGADGVQLRGPHAFRICRWAWISRMASYIRTIGRGWAWNWI